MKLTIEKNDLSRVFSLVQNIGEKKTSMPILLNILLIAEGSSLKLFATDLTLSAMVEIPAKVLTPGKTTVNTKVFSEIVRELPEGSVELKVTEGERFEIITEHSRLRIIGQSADEFPGLPGIGVDAKGKISASQLSEMIQKTLYAVSTDETRYNLTGVCFESISEKKGQNLLRAVSTDGHRLAAMTKPSQGLKIAERAVVPRKGLQEIKRLLDLDAQAEIGVDIKDGFFVVETKTAKVASRLIDGEYPEYEQVIPKTTGVLAKIRSSEFAQSLRRVLLLVTDKNKGVKLDFSKDKLRVTSSSPELGDAREELTVEYQGEPFSVGFNAKYLLDIAELYPEGTILHLDLHGDVGPCKISPESDESSLAIVMPMRL